MSTILKSKTSLTIFTIVAAALLFLSFSFFFSTNTSAGREDDLMAETSRLEDEIASAEAYLSSLQEQENTLAVKIEQLDGEIATELKKIELTENKIEELKLEIAKTEAELERQKDLLRHSIVTLYKEGNITTIELLASSDSYTDFINQQEYLSRIKDQIHDSATQVEELIASLEVEKKAQDDLLLKLEAQRDLLNSKRSEQQRILEQTQGENARYQVIIGDLQAQKEAAQATLDAYLASLIHNAVSLGPVYQGEVVGLVGNTGYSSGPHVHYKMYTANTISFGVDPISTLPQLGWSWNQLVSGGGILTQPWGCSGLGVYSWNPAYGCGFHDAIDIAAPEGTPLFAPADGDIIHRGCLYTGTIFSTFMVIIDHGNGYYSSYAHLVAPDDPAYNACRGNTYY